MLVQHPAIAFAFACAIYFVVTWMASLIVINKYDRAPKILRRLKKKGIKAKLANTQITDVAGTLSRIVAFLLPPLLQLGSVPASRTHVLRERCSQYQHDRTRTQRAAPAASLLALVAACALAALELLVAHSIVVAVAAVVACGIEAAAALADHPAALSFLHLNSPRASHTRLTQQSRYRSPP